MRVRTLAATAIVFTLGAAMAGCGGSHSDSPAPVQAAATFAAGSTMERLNKAQKITIGTKFDQPGFGLKGLSGKPEGFDVEIAKLIAGELGIPADKIEWVETPSKIREDVIEQGKVDMVVATYTINDQRKQRVSFAGPYYEAGQNIMVAKNDTSITGPASFRDGTKKVCSVTGSTPAETIKTYLKDVASQLVLFDTYDKCRDALKGGQVDAVTTDNVILLGYIANGNGAFKMAASNFTKEPYGIGVKKDDTAFKEFINSTLQKLFTNGSWKAAWDRTAGKFGAPLGDPPTIDRT